MGPDRSTRRARRAPPDRPSSAGSAGYCRSSSVRRQRERPSAGRACDTRPVGRPTGRALVRARAGPCFPSSPSRARRRRRACCSHPASGSRAARRRGWSQASAASCPWTGHTAAAAAAGKPPTRATRRSARRARASRQSRASAGRWLPTGPSTAARCASTMMRAAGGSLAADSAEPATWTRSAPAQTRAPRAGCKQGRRKGGDGAGGESAGGSERSAARGGEPDFPIGLSRTHVGMRISELESSTAERSGGA
jgi:hypothetical protein